MLSEAGGTMCSGYLDYQERDWNHLSPIFFHKNASVASFKYDPQTTFFSY